MYGAKIVCRTFAASKFSIVSLLILLNPLLYVLRHALSVFAMKHRILLLLLLAVISPLPCLSSDFHDYVPLGQSQIKAIVPTETRSVIDLSGPWTIADGADESATVNLPGTLASTQSVTVRRTFKIDKHTLASRAWQLMFLGVSDEVVVKVNNRFVTRHPGGSSPFTTDINERLLIAGTNVIELTISAGADLRNLVRRFAPFAPKPWMGITREIFLIGTPHVWTSEVNTSTAFSNTYSVATLAAHVTIRGGNVDKVDNSDGTDNAMKQGSVMVGVEGILRSVATGEVVARASNASVRVERARTTHTSLDLQVTNPRLWTPTEPNLYELEVRCTVNGALVDSYTTNLGLRSIRIAAKDDSRWLRLNDEPTFINAIDYVEEYPKTGPTLTWRQMEHDVAMLKTLGVNTIRVVHGAPHPYLLYLCDKYGLMVMAEVHAASIPSAMLGTEEITAHLRNQADLLASYVGTHPSVIAVGLSELLQEGSPQTQDYHQSIAKVLRNRVSAPIYKVVAGQQIGMVSEGGFDIIIVSAVFPWNRSHLEKILTDAKRVIRSAAILTQVGTLVSPGNSNGFSDPLSLESEAVALRDGRQSTRSANLAGCIVSSFTDYTLAMPTMLVDSPNAYLHSSGLVDAWRQPRVAYEMYKSIINDEKEPLLQARDYTDATPLVFVGTGLVLALVLTFLINRSRRFREYFIRSIIRPYNFYADIRDQRILSTIQTTILGAVIATAIGLVLGATLYFLRTDPSTEYLLHLALPFDWLYKVLRYIAWRPAAAVTFFAILSFVKLNALASVLRLCSVFVRGKVLYRDTLTIVVWSCVPLLALLPIGIALYQLMSADAMTFWVPFTTVLAVVWTLFRTLRATSVVFDVPALVVYGIGLGAFALIAGIFLTLWILNYEVLDFLQYYRTVLAV